MQVLRKADEKPAETNTSAAKNGERIIKIVLDIADVERGANEKRISTVQSHIAKQMEPEEFDDLDDILNDMNSNSEDEESDVCSEQSKEGLPKVEIVVEEEDDQDEQDAGNDLLASCLDEIAEEESCKATDVDRTTVVKSNEVQNAQGLQRI